MKKLLLVVFAGMTLFSCKKVSTNSDVAFANSNAKSTAQIGPLATTTPKKFLFDAKKAETAGNADWVIDQDNSTPQRIPTPLQSTITATTAETYWVGALSSWGIALAKKGHTVETLPSTGTITYGSTTNAQDLSKYDVYVVDEPNIVYTAAEKVAIINFVKNGGGLFMIANHSGSDRNNDGWDPPAIWNDLMTNNTVASNPFGFKIDLTNYSQTSTNVTAVANTITNGSEGIANTVKFSSGSSVTLTSGGLAKGLFWKTGIAKTSLTSVMAAYSTYGTGRVVVICDSSPADDGTGNPSDVLYKGWTDVSGNHTRFHMNASLWLAKLQ